MARVFNYIFYAAAIGAAFYFAQPYFGELAGEASEGFHVIKPHEAVTLVGLLERYKPMFGKGEYEAYLNHCLRVLSYTEYFMGDLTDDQREIAEAALAYHDIVVERRQAELPRAQRRASMERSFRQSRADHGHHHGSSQSDRFRRKSRRRVGERGSKGRLARLHEPRRNAGQIRNATWKHLPRS